MSREVFDSYAAAIRLVMDFDTLATITEQISFDVRLTDDERETLYPRIDARHFAILPQSVFRGMAT